MSIKTNLTQEDYAAFLTFISRSVSATRQDKLIRIFIALAIGLGIGLWLSMSNLASNPGVLPALLCGALAGSFGLMVLISAFSRRQMRRLRPDDDGYMLGSQEVSPGEGGIRLRSTYHEAASQWSVVRQEAVTQNHVFVLIDRIAAIIVPTRSFASEAEREEFVSEIERRSGKTRS